MSGAYFKGGKIVGGAEGDTDTFLTQNFDNVSLSDFTQVGLVLEAASPISGTTSAKLTHQPAVNQSFKETRAVSEKFRGSGVTVVITAKSGATLGNVTVLFRDETNNVPLQSSQQISANSTVGVFQYGVKIPSNCLSFSYTITALPESGSPVTYIDDVTIKSYWTGTLNQGQTQYIYESPVVTDWVSYTPVFANLGTVSNSNFKWRRIGNTIEVKGTVDVGTPLAAIANMTLPNGYTAIQSATPGYYYIVGTWARSGNVTNHGGVVIVASGNDHVHFSGANAWSGGSLATMSPGNGTVIVNAGEFLSIEFSVGIAGLEATETKTFVSTDLVPAKSMNGSMSIDVPIITGWQDYTPTFQGFGTPTNIEFEWRRVGENVEIRGKFQGGTTTAVEARIGLPSTLISANTSLIPSIQVQGYAIRGSTANEAFHVLVEPSVNYVTIARSAGGLTKVTGSNFLASSDFASIFASIPCTGFSATESKVWSSTQTLLTEGEDEALQWNDWTATTSSSGTTTFTFTGGTIVSAGSHITYIKDAVNGDRFVINKTGFYALKVNMDYGTPSSGYMGFTRNSPSLSTSVLSIAPAFTLGKDYGADLVACAWSGPLVAGDVIRLQANGATVGGTGFYNLLSFNYVGSTKSVQTVSDQKIDIPTSELVMYGFLGRGAVATGIARFDTIQKIRGDALSVLNTANDGTAVTVRKSGLISISTSLYATAANIEISITKNKSVLTNVSPVVGETLSTEYTSGSGDIFACSWSGFVNAGDVIRVTSSSSSISNSAPGYNNLSIAFQEQTVQVAVTNVLPQFDDKDFFLKVTTAAATYGSINTTILRFTSVQELIGNGCVRFEDSATLGSTFTILESGLYSLTAVGHSSTNNDAGGLNIIKNSIVGGNPSDSSVIAISYDRQNTASVQNRYMNASAQAYLKAGDVVRVIAGSTVLNNSVLFSISKVKSPSVTGVDVTPFIKVPLLQKQYAMYTYNGEWNTGSNLVTLTTLQESKGSGLFELTTTGLRIIREGYIDVGLSAGTNSGVTLTAYILKNGLYVSVDLERVASATSVYSNAGWSGFVNAGDVFTFITASAVGTDAAGSRLVVNMEEASSEQILSESDAVSSDSIKFNWAPSSLYDLATLPDSPIGTYITFTRAGNSTVGGLTQTTGANRPTQPDLDMNINGINMFLRTYAGASTPGNPGTVYINIGKNYKGIDFKYYKSAGRLVSGIPELYVTSGDVNQRGFFTQEYDPETGILFLDPSMATSTAVTNSSMIFVDGTLTTSCYVTFNASKNPALTGINASRGVAARVVNTSGTVYGSTTATLVFDATKTYDTHGAFNTATGIFTSPESGYYQVNCHLLFTSAVYVVTQAILLSIVKNGLQYPSSLSRTPIQTTTSINAEAQLYDTVYLAKGDTLSISVQNERGNTALIAGFNWLSISKVRD